MRFRATLKFRKFKVALNPLYRIFLNFAKSCISYNVHIMNVHYAKFQKKFDSRTISRELF